MLLLVVFMGGVIVGGAGAIFLSNWAVERGIRAAFPRPQDLERARSVGQDRAGQREGRWYGKRQGPEMWGYSDDG